MKVIVNVNKKSAYAKYNGLTFEVVNIYSTFVALSIPMLNPTLPAIVDFRFNEVLIVDIKQELTQARLDLEVKQIRSQSFEREQIALDNLRSYCKKNKIQL